MNHPAHIIDSHCHAWKGDGFTGPWDTHAPLTRFMQWSGEYKIRKTVLFAAFHSDYSLANRKVAEIVNAYPDRFYGYAFVHAGRDAGRIRAMIEVAVKQYRFCGIKLHRHDSLISREICEVARSFQLPVLYDVMGEISQTHLLAEEYPDVNFIIPHLGSFADDWRAQKAFIDPLSRYRNIFTDSSGVRRFDLLREAYERAGAHKILFGSDGPWLHPGVELEKIYALRAGEQDQALMLSGNFLRLIQRAGQPAAEIRSDVTASNSLSHEFRSADVRDPWLTAY